jgi:hypothetical protein
VIDEEAPHTYKFAKLQIVGVKGHL